ncbi:MAG: glycosyltransferase family 1 protein [bacterium]|nr:glycosyltransferase family 1 protein [bacterium]
MRVAIDARMARITGIGRYTDELVTGLELEGLKPTVFVSPGDAAWWHHRHPHLPYRIAPESIYSWSEQLIFPSRLMREHFDVVHFTNFNVPLAYRRPFVVTIHDTIPLQYSGERRRSGLSRQAYQRVIRSALARAQRVIVPSMMVKEELAQLGDVSHVGVVMHGIGETFLGPVTERSCASAVFSRLKIEAPYILYVGNDRSHKNIEQLIRAFGQARTALASGQLVLAGPTSPHRGLVLRHMVEELDLDRSVRFCANPDDATLTALYDGARALVVPSLVEGFGLPALEAAARGTLVIASETTPVREFLHDAVLTFNPLDADQLANTIVVAWHNQKIRTTLGQKGRAYALRRDWQMVARETIQLYERAQVGRLL